MPIGEVARPACTAMRSRRTWGGSTLPTDRGQHQGGCRSSPKPSVMLSLTWVTCATGCRLSPDAWPDAGAPLAAALRSGTEVDPRIRRVPCPPTIPAAHSRRGPPTPKPSAWPPPALGIAGMQRELARLLARGVELVTRTAIEQSSNYVHREAVLESARVVYTAPRLRVLPGYVAHRTRRVFLYGAHVFRRRRAGPADAAVGSQVGGDSWRGLGAVDRRQEAATEIVYFRKSVGRMLSSPQLSVVHAAIRVTAQASRS